MALAKLKKNLLEVIIGALITMNLATICLYIDKKADYSETINANAATIEKLETQANELEKENTKLSSMVDYNTNSSSTIGAVREDLAEYIQEAVSKRGKEMNNPSLSIDKLDAMRALKSAENRVMDEYIRLTALVLATMNTESNFTYKVNENSNGTKDYGIMQVNDVVISHIKEALGENIDPINNKTDNVESGSWEIYDCYIQAKEKHPEDVIWWTYAYYNRGKYFENTDAWKNPKNSSYEAVHKQAETRSNIFKEAYTYYYNELKEAIDNE